MIGDGVRVGDARRRCRRVAVAVLIALAGVVAVGNLPVSSDQGVDFVVSKKRMPLYRKVFEFLDRDAQYRELAGGITDQQRSAEQRILDVFDWTNRRIKATPDGWTIVDDHILNIVIRGYGTSDQRADVCATLLTYAGVPSFWTKVRAAGSDVGVILTFMRIGEQWAVADVANGYLFRRADGALATVDDFPGRRVVLPAGIDDVLSGGVRYSEILAALRLPRVPQTLRAELQMPWPRLRYQTARVFGRSDDGEENESRR